MQNKDFFDKPFDDEEKDLMALVESGKTEKASNEEVMYVKKILSNSPSKLISLRLSEFDLTKLKEKAEVAGIPYQTLINSVLHRYITGDVVIRTAF